MKVKFRVHLDVKLIRVSKDVDAFIDLSIQTFLEGSLHFNFEAGVVLDLVWVEFSQVPRKCIGWCVGVDGGFVALEPVVSRESTFPVIARGDVNLAAVHALARVHGAALGVRAALLSRLTSPALREFAACQI